MSVVNDFQLHCRHLKQLIIIIIIISPLVLLRSLAIQTGGSLYVFMRRVRALGVNIFVSFLLFLWEVKVYIVSVETLEAVHVFISGLCLCVSK